MIRSLIFDFDGIILDTEAALLDAHHDVHAAHGKPFDRATFAGWIGHVEIAFDEWAAFGPHVDRQSLHEEMKWRYRERADRQPVQPGVVALCDAAREAGCRLAIASNSSREHCTRHLSRLGLLDRFDFMACRESVASPKPEPDLYRLAVNQLGVRAHEAVAFEDSAAGTIAAHRAGLWVMAVPTPVTRQHDFSKAHWRVASLAEITLPGLQRLVQEHGSSKNGRHRQGS